MKSKLPLLLGACGAALAGALLLHAQPGPAVSAAPAQPAAQFGKPGDKLDFLRGQAAERLGLTAEQQAKLDAIRDSRRAEVGALLQDKSLTAEQRREKIRATMKAGFEEAKTVLTPEQQEKAKKFVQHMKQRRGPGGPGGFARQPAMAHGAGPMMARPAPGPVMQRAPGLMRAELAERLDLTAEQRKQLADLRFQIEEKELALHKEVKALRAQMKAVLTPEQQKKAEQFRERGHGGRRGPQAGPRFSADDAYEAEPPPPLAFDDADIPADRGDEADE